MAFIDSSKNYVGTMDKELLSRRAQFVLKQIVATSDPVTGQAMLSGVGNRSTSVRVRPFGNAQAPAGNYCTGMRFIAPGAYDGIRVIVHGSDNSGANAFKWSVAAANSYGANNSLLDVAGNPLTPTPVTWGATTFDDVRVVGNQATMTVTNASGAGATLREGDVISDYISLRSPAGVAAPWIDVKVWGTNPPMINANESDAGGWSTVIPGFSSGVWGADLTGSATPGTYAFAGWFPSCTVVFYLRGQAISLHVAGDSLDQGWIDGASVPQFGGNINGWVRKLVAQLNASGTLTTLSNGALVGSKSYPFHERAYNALLTGAVTHLLIKPWSVNEGGDGTASVPPALERTTRVLDLARRKGVVATVIRPWAGQGLTSAPGILVQQYCDQLAATGARVFDARAIVTAGAGANADAILPAYLTRNGAGAVVDTTHLNEAGHTAVAALAYEQRAVFGLV